MCGDVIYSNVYVEERRCTIVVIYYDVDGLKQLLVIEEGFRESTDT